MIVVFDVNTFLELAKKENEYAFVFKQTKKNYEFNTLQCEAKFYAFYKNQPLTYSYYSKVLSLDDKNLDKELKAFEDEVEKLIEKVSNVLSVREGVLLE